MNSYVVKDIKPKSYFSKAVYLDEEVFFITAPEMPFTEETAALLEKWKFDKVFSEGEPQADMPAAPAQEAAAKGTAAGKSAAPSRGAAFRALPEESITIISQQSDADKLEKASKFYLGLIAYVEKMFIKATISDELAYKDVTERVLDMVEYIKEDRRFLMRIIKSIEAPLDKNYIAIHSVRSTILSIIIGTYLKMPNHRLVELGVAAILHEVGMLKLPSNIYLSDKPLAPAEQKAIMTHPVLGYTLLKAFNFPIPICLAALEHHERENSSGYPRKLTSEKISLYSKIIAVACSYEALSTKRPHKEAKDGYTAMLELLKNEGKQYDDTVVRALVLSLSIYPIGLYVMLSNGKKGQVIDVNPENPRFPIVQVFGDLTPDGKIKTYQTAQGALTIVRPLNRNEIDV